MVVKNRIVNNNGVITSDNTQKTEILADHIQDNHQFEEKIDKCLRNLVDTAVIGIENKIPSVVFGIEFKANESTINVFRWEDKVDKVPDIAISKAGEAIILFPTILFNSQFLTPEQMQP